MKEEEEKKEQIRKALVANKKRMEEYTRPHREREARIKYLEEKFNPKKGFLKKVADNFLSTEDDMDDDIQKYRKQRSIEKEYPVFTSPSNVQYRTEGERVIEREREKREGSKYNIFVKEKYAEIKETHPEMDRTKIFAEIGRRWQEEKKKEKFNPNKDKMIEHGKQNQINILKKLKNYFQR